MLTLRDDHRRDDPRTTLAAKQHHARLVGKTRMVDLVASDSVRSVVIIPPSCAS
ncbi:MAG TPA: hypothetical protein VHN14_07790 [Kofleriaceae bacterium]|jgi:hypothetical protein|nr:hypothetical protein [Kofleriaceae bacterium]